MEDSVCLASLQRPVAHSRGMESPKKIFVAVWSSSASTGNPERSLAQDSAEGTEGLLYCISD